MKFEEIHEDQRGTIHGMWLDDREYIVLFTKKGHIRGGDYHKTKQYDVVLSGKMNINWKESISPNSKEHSITLTEGDMICFEPDNPHMFIAMEDTLMVEWLVGDFEKSFYEQYRRLVK